MADLTTLLSKFLTMLWSGNLEWTKSGIAATSTDGLVVSNDTASTAGIPVQRPGRLRFRGNVWNTTAVAANNTDDWFIDPLPVSGATPSSLWRLGSSLHGAAATYPFQGTSAGSWQVGDGTAAAPSLTFASAPTVGWFQGDSSGWQFTSIGGTTLVYMGTAGINLAADGKLQWTSTANNPRAGVDISISRESAAVLQLGLDAAGVTNQMFKGPDRITSDGVGGNLTIAGGRNRGASAGGAIIFQTSPAAVAEATGTLATRQTIDSVGGIVHGAGDAGAATTSYRLPPKKVTAIADNTATDVLTVTIPNANHSAGVFLKFVVTNKHADDTCESTRIATGAVAFARVTGAVAVATAATIDTAAIATAGAATLTLAYGVSAVAGAAEASNTFTIQVTIDDSGNKGSNQCVVLAELVNAEATGVTIA